MRWKFLIPFLIIIAAIAAFNIIFLDSLIKKAAISGGEIIFGARVEISSLSTNFKNLSITIKDLRIADKNDEWTNLFESGNIHFGVRPLPLLTKKIVIDEMSVEGLRWGTKRKTSGFLPPAKIARLNRADKDSFTSKLLKKIEERAAREFAALPPVETIANIQKSIKDVSVENAVNALDLQSLKEMDAMSKEVSAKYSQYTQNIDNLKIQEKIDNSNRLINEIKAIDFRNVSDIENAKNAITKLQETKTDLEKTYNDVKAIQSQAGADFGREQDWLKKINELKDKDFQNISGKLKLPAFSYQNVSQAIFGPVWVQRINTVVYYMGIARKYMPARKKEDKKIVKKRLKGMDVSFPSYNALPDFLIAKMSLSGSTGGDGKTGEAIDFSGKIEDITSDPILIGRPIKLTLSGIQGTKKINIEGIADHTTDEPVERLSIAYSGLDVKDFGIPSSDYLPQLNKGDASIAANFTLKGGAIEGTLHAALTSLSPEITPQSNDEAQKILSSLWYGVSTITLDASLGGTLENMNISLSSNIDKILSDRLKNIYGEQLANIQNRLHAEIDKLTSQKKEEFLNEFTIKKNEVSNRIMEKQKDIGLTIDALNTKKTEVENKIKSRIDAEKNKAEEEINRRKEEEKRKAEEELKKRSEEEFKKLFK